MYFEAFGNVGIGTTTPDEKLHIAGNMRLDGTFEDKDGEAGSSGQILSSTATGTDWIAATSGGDFSNGGEAVGADRSLGNTDNYALSFKTDNTSRFKIQNDGGIRIDGNIGIFTNPDEISNINKSIKLYASKNFSNPNLNISGHNSGNIHLESRRVGSPSETSGKKWTISSGSGSVLDLDKFSISNVDDGNCFTIRDGGNIGIGFNEPKSKLQVNGGVQIANDSDAASADKVGTLRYRADSNNSYVEMCMQTGASSYIWVIIKQNTW